MFRSGLLPGCDFAPLSVDRAAIERVYHEHRTGTKPPFEEAMPPALLARLVREDAKKEAVLARTYGVTITDAMVAAEVERINYHHPRAGDARRDQGRAGRRPRAFRPRDGATDRRRALLHEKFQNDPKLHAASRARAEQLRKQTLALPQPDKRLALLQSANEARAVTWQLAARSETTPVKPEIKSADYAIEATIDRAPEKGFYFEDLDPELQQVLRVQLTTPGDISAVIETPTAFLLSVPRTKPAKR